VRRSPGVAGNRHPVAERPGFKAMLDRIAGNGVRVILVESPDRFARDLMETLAARWKLRVGFSISNSSKPWRRISAKGVRKPLRRCGSSSPRLT